MSGSDSRPYGIKKLREKWPSKYAIGAVLKVPSGAYHCLSTDLPKELGQEILGKITWYMGGHEWKKWVPDTPSTSVCNCKKCCDERRWK